VREIVAQQVALSRIVLDGAVIDRLTRVFEERLVPESMVVLSAQKAKEAFRRGYEASLEWYRESRRESVTDTVRPVGHKRAEPRPSAERAPRRGRLKRNVKALPSTRRAIIIGALAIAGLIATVLAVDHYVLQRRPFPALTAAALENLVQANIESFNSHTLDADFYPQIAFEDLRVSNITPEENGFSASVFFRVRIRNTAYMNLTGRQLRRHLEEAQCGRLRGTARYEPCLEEMRLVRISTVSAGGSNSAHPLEWTQQQICALFFDGEPDQFVYLQNCPRLSDGNVSRFKSVRLRIIAYSSARRASGFSGLWRRVFWEEDTRYLISRRAAGSAIEPFFGVRPAYYD
jgi:hypothetical protein